MAKLDGISFHPLKIEAAKQLAESLQLSDKEREELQNAFCSGRDDISDETREALRTITIDAKNYRPIPKIVRPIKRNPSLPGEEEPWVSE